MSRFPLLLLLVGLASSDVGTCNRKTEPLTWLETTGRGLVDWATAGAASTGPNFCMQGNRDNNTVEIDYHIHVDDTYGLVVEQHSHQLYPNVSENNCLNQNSSIRLCLPFCWNDDLQNIITAAVLNNKRPQAVADEIFVKYGQPEKTAIGVIQLSLTDPTAHVDAQSFMGLQAWCSIYIGVKTTGFPYVMEVQVGQIY